MMPRAHLPQQSPTGVELGNHCIEILAPLPKRPRIRLQPRIQLNQFLAIAGFQIGHMFHNARFHIQREERGAEEEIFTAKTRRTRRESEKHINRKGAEDTEKDISKLNPTFDLPLRHLRL
jgi:hypothetical protein